jgi:2,3-dihydroxybenzoate decarboxylase
MAELQRLLANGLPMKKNITTYFHTNIYETTSGNFATELLTFHINQIGLDRIMYSIDYPFVSLMFLPPPFFFR